MNIEKEYVLEMKDITKHYGENTVLNGVSLSVKKGEIHALLGENGAGKSTFLRLAAGILKADGGHVTIDGEEVFENIKAKKKFSIYLTMLIFQ